MIRVSVIIPTFRRPESFRRAALSVFAQAGVDGVELIAVDNSPEGSALEVFRALDRDAPIPFRWMHEPRPGVAHARNAALPYARGEFIAWLDDDEEAPAHWLAALVAVRRETGAQSVFGPVRAQAPQAGRHAAFFERLYSRAGPSASGPIAQNYGIGNSLQPRALFSLNEFDVAANETGGEDDALFASWREAGATFAWAAEAAVTEHVGHERSRLAHGLKRAFAYGQGPCETAWAARDFAALARHMIVGAGQAAAYGMLTALIVVVSRGRALSSLDRAARGAGKVFWFFEQRFYGAALTARD
ncbi:glycosyltransferase family 2 protein [Terricaulis sp.]|uniref:glycosyltransferase family 2 protein n=1 Tax=Terricaulis sp. TaxID=2768686 RepID=UPI0037852CC2